MDCATHKRLADKLFEKKSSLNSLHQTIAENFYPERADFTVTRYLGEEFGIDLQTSYPVLARRDLGDSFSSLMPIEEFEMTVSDEESVDQVGKVWLESRTKIQRRAMLDRVARLDRALKEGDQDYAAFGQFVISIELTRGRQLPGGAWDPGNLLYRTWHLKDFAWCENDEGEIDYKVHKRKFFARDLIRLFPKTVSQSVKDICDKDPFAEIDTYRVVCACSYYTDEKWHRWPFVSTWFEAKDAHLLEQVGQWTGVYRIPRWQTLSGSQYAYSPAAIVALPDARLIQTMTGVLLEAGEKAVNPPMTAFAEMLRSDVNIYPGGITYLDAMHDDRMKGKPLELMTNDKSGIPIGLEMQQDTRAMIREAFFLNKLTMPAPSKQMTAYEVGQRVSEWVRQSRPLFMPLETERNAAICEDTSVLLMRGGAFGPLAEIPQSLRRRDLRFKFKSPLREAEDAQAAVALQKSRELLDAVMDVDPGAANVVKFRDAYRKAVESIGMEKRFIRGADETDALTDEQNEQRAAQAELAQAEQGGKAVKELADANLKLSKAA